MTKYLLCFAAGILFISFSLASRAETKIAPFKTDGCSAFIDGSIVPRGKSWAHCCVAHDLIYWRGGVKLERTRADRALVSCVNRTVGHSDRNPHSLGWLMWAGVRVGGGPYPKMGGNPFSWRWGYGWNKKPSYRELAAEEKDQCSNGLINAHYDLPNILGDLWLSSEQVVYIQDKIDRQIFLLTSAPRIL
jgi:hypothetical protein